MKLQHKHREIMVFSISFLDVIASALGAILILFIIQYNKTQTARTEAVVSEARHTQCTEALQEFARSDTQLATTATPYDATSEKPFDRTTDHEHEKQTEHPHPEEPVMAPLAVAPVAPMNVAPVPRDTAMRELPEQPQEPLMGPATADATGLTRPDPAPDRNDPVMSEPTMLEPGMAEPVMTEVPTRPDPKKAAALKVAPELPTKVETPPAMAPEKPRPEEKEKRILPELPAGYEGKTLATCVTSRESVTVKFFDYDQPDGDTIMVSWNGRNMTRIKLEEKPTAGYVFTLAKGRYNIIVIKNISNGFYPVNTANVSISGCGQARWKIREVGDSRVIYVYRE